VNGLLPLHFTKMHGCGNDFVVLDLRGGRAAPPPARVRAMGHRHTGVGFDQLLTLEDANRTDCVARYRIWNSDGTSAQQCGNGARCVAAWLRRDGSAVGRFFRLDSPTGPVDVECREDGQYAVAMGRPDFTPARVPFHADLQADRYALTLDRERVAFGAVSLGNPHAVVEVPLLDEAPVAAWGQGLQAREEFPSGVNVGFAQVLGNDRIRLRVFERGAGETLACGSGACAAVAVLARQGRVGRQVSVELPGGTLEIQWPDDASPIVMAGPAAFVFEGEYA
jgi:diaminopimelate epimerase